MFLALGLGDGETLDVVAAAGEQPDDAREHAGLVLHQHRERVRLVRIVALFQEVGGCGLVHCRPRQSLVVMPGLAGIHVAHLADGRGWPGKPAMTTCSLHATPLRGGGIRPDPFPEQIEIDIAAGQDQADALAGELGLFLQRGGERGRAGAFGEIMRVGPVGADRAATSSSVTCTMREAPLRMIASASASGTRVAMPSASVLLVSVVTTVPAANDSA